MHIVIEISEEDYKEVRKDTYSGTSFENRVFSAIDNGTPLPKGHGRLIDADSLIKAIEEKAKRLSNADTINGLYGAVALIFDEQTIIEADKTESEDKE